jgi:hypothetical protein
MFSSNEFVPCQSSQPVTVEVDGGGVHRDELGDVRVAPLAAVDDVGRPDGGNSITLCNLFQRLKYEQFDDAISIIFKSFVDNEYFFIGNKV